MCTRNATLALLHLVGEISTRVEEIDDVFVEYEHYLEQQTERLYSDRNGLIE